MVRVCLETLVVSVVSLNAFQALARYQEVTDRYTKEKQSVRTLCTCATVTTPMYI